MSYLGPVSIATAKISGDSAIYSLPTGLRSVRYLKEIDGIRSVTVNDLMADATDTAKVECSSMNA